MDQDLSLSSHCTADTRVSRSRQILPQVIATSANILLFLSLGMLIGFPTVLIPVLTAKNNESQPHFTVNEASWYVSLSYIFQPVGSIVAGAFLQSLGCKRLMILLNIPQFVCWLIAYFATSNAILYVAHALVGCVLGLMEGPGLRYVIEISHPSVRGVLATCTTLFISLGFLFIIFLGSLTHWRHVALISSLVPALCIIILFQIPETPLWLMSKGKPDEALLSLQWLRGWTSAEMVKDEFAKLEFYAKQRTFKVVHGYRNEVDTNDEGITDKTGNERGHGDNASGNAVTNSVARQSDPSGNAINNSDVDEKNLSKNTLKYNDTDHRYIDGKRIKDDGADSSDPHHNTVRNGDPDFTDLRSGSAANNRRHRVSLNMGTGSDDEGEDPGGNAHTVRNRRHRVSFQIEEGYAKREFAQKWRDVTRREMLVALGKCCTLFAVFCFGGISPLRPYLVKIFEGLNSPVEANWSSVLVASSGIIGNIGCMLLIKPVGKKPLLVFSLACSALCLISLSFFLMGYTPTAVDSPLGRWWPLTMFLALFFFYNIGLSPIAWMYVGEILPYRGRGVATSIAVSFYYLVTFVAVKTFSTLVQELKLQGVFFVYAAVCVGGIFFTYFLPETEGRFLSDIETEITQDKDDERDSP